MLSPFPQILFCSIVRLRWTQQIQQFQQEIGRLTALLGQPKALSESIEIAHQAIGGSDSAHTKSLALANLHFLNNSIEDAQLHWELALQINPNIVAALPKLCSFAFTAREA